jgi:ATP-binding cassette subfamily C protein
MRIAGIELPPPIEAAVEASRQHFVVAAVFSLLINLLYLAPSIYMLQVYDRVLASGGKTTLLFVTIALAIALVTLSGLDAIRSRLLVRASAKLDSELAPQVMRRLLSVGTRENVQAMRDLDTVRQTISSPASAALFDLPWAPIYIVVCFLLHFWIGVLAVASIILLLLLARKHQSATRASIEISSQALAASHSAEQAAAVHAGTIRGLGMVQAMVNRQLSHRSIGMARLAEAHFGGSRYAALSRFLRLFVQSAALGLGALLAIAGDISSGAIIAGSILLGRALQPIDAMVGGWNALASGQAALRRLAEALGQPFDADRTRTSLPDPKGAVAVENIGVRGGEGQIVLNGVSFTADPGEVLGIIGPSGSGKTTLARVIVGAIVPEIGNVRIDGAQRADWDADTLGRHFGYLPQEPSLFEGTIKENVSRFAPWASTTDESTDARVVAAAKLAGVHEMILKLPQGYDSRLGPLGAGLSAGQSQRVALARALYGDPAIVVLDEPNAFLDAEGEAALLNAIAATRSRGAAVILIAHRRSVLDIADMLLVLDGGRPKMLGPAHDVMKRLAAPAAESAA